jgi:glyoxylase-like metal-dependent hydrolase (beta-lactamase superfamily II)
MGDARVHVLRDGTFALDGGAVFGVVPRVIWEKTNPPDEKNRVTLAMNVTLVEAAGKRILVDTGLGDDWGEKDRAIYRMERSPTLLAALRGLGLGPEDIDVVVNTHLHFDHAGGNVRVVDGRASPAFPRARYVIQRGEWEDALHPNERSRGSYRESCLAPLAGSSQLDLVEGETELAPGVRAVPVGGHTAHHQMVVVEGGGRTLAVPTDLLPTASHAPLAFATSYDLYPVATLEAKRRLLERAAQEEWLVVLYHDLRMPLARVGLHEGRPVLSEARA